MTVVEIEKKVKVSLRDYFKKLAMRKSNITLSLESAKNGLKEMQKVYDEEIADIEADFAAAENHIDSDVIEELQVDINAYTSISAAFPDHFPSLQKKNSKKGGDK